MTINFNNKNLKKSHSLIAIVLLVLIIDQVTKIWVKTNMYIGEDSFLHWSSTPIWGRIHFVENNGMAFGFELWDPYGKLVLSLFRIIAVGFLIYFIRKLIESKASMGLLISFSLILAGAIGNIIDSAFYGLIFSESPYHGGPPSQLFPEGGGYETFLYGKVVDMLYFPLYDGFYPEWFPFWGGDRFEFFKPVFNIADVSISTGVISILLFQRSFFSTEIDEQKGEASSILASENVETPTTEITEPSTPLNENGIASNETNSVLENEIDKQETNQIEKNEDLDTA